MAQLIDETEIDFLEHIDRQGRWKTVFDRIDANFDAIIEYLRTIGARIRIETFTAIKNQTEFHLTNKYSTMRNSLAVYLNGARQFLGTGFNETSPTTFELVQPCQRGDEVKAVYLQYYILDDIRDLDQLLLDEFEDAKTGWDGKKYGSLADAIRDQIFQNAADAREYTQEAKDTLEHNAELMDEFNERNDKINEDEAQRQANEKERIEHEIERQSHEEDRLANEDTRIENESTRVDNEVLREERETVREENQSQNNADQERNNSEQAKNNADQAANNQAAMGLQFQILQEGEYDPETLYPLIEGTTGKFYLAPYHPPEGEDTNIFAEWIWDAVNLKFERIGDTSMSLTPVSTDQIDQIVDNDEVIQDDTFLKAAGLSYLVQKLKEWIFTDSKIQMAQKLENEVIIKVAHDVIGRAAFDGSQNITINVTRRGCMVGQSTEKSDRPWYKFADVVLDDPDLDAEITFHVKHTMMNKEFKGGMLTARVMSNTDGTFAEGGYLEWEYASANINPDDFVLVHNSTTPCVAELWVKVDQGLSSYTFDVVSESSSTKRGAEDVSFWLLYDSISRGSEENYTQEFTCIPSKVAGISVSNIDDILRAHIETIRDALGLATSEKNGLILKLPSAEV